jgi:hypothetical protein
MFANEVASGYATMGVVFVEVFVCCGHSCDVTSLLYVRLGIKITLRIRLKVLLCAPHLHVTGSHPSWSILLHFLFFGTYLQPHRLILISSLKNCHRCNLCFGASSLQYE